MPRTKLKQKIFFRSESAVDDVAASWCFAELVNLSTFNFRTSIEPLSTMISVLFNIFSYLSFDLGGNFVN